MSVRGKASRENDTIDLVKSGTLNAGYVTDNYIGYHSHKCFQGVLWHGEVVVFGASISNQTKRCDQ